MAKLSSEDREVESTLELVPGPVVDQGEIMRDQSWQEVGLVLSSGPFMVELGHTKDGSDPEDDTHEECLLCRVPKDEVNELAGLIEDLISGQKETIVFEPAEPFFELRVSKAQVFGYKVEAWLDSGNATTGVYRWDGVGIRMHTTRENLASFTKQLREQFGC